MILLCMRILWWTFCTQNVSNPNTDGNRLDIFVGQSELHQLQSAPSNSTQKFAVFCHELGRTTNRDFGSFGNEPVQSCSVRRVVSSVSSAWRHLCTALPVTALIIETLYLANICSYTPSICT